MRTQWFGGSETCHPPIVALSFKTPRNFHIGHRSRHGATAQPRMMENDESICRPKNCATLRFFGDHGVVCEYWSPNDGFMDIHDQKKCVQNPIMTDSWWKWQDRVESLMAFFDAWPPKRSLESIHGTLMMVLWCQLWSQLSTVSPGYMMKSWQKFWFGIWIMLKTSSIKESPSPISKIVWPHTAGECCSLNDKESDHIGAHGVRLIKSICCSHLWYHLVLEHSFRKSQFSFGKSTINGHVQ